MIPAVSLVLFVLLSQQPPCLLATPGQQGRPWSPQEVAMTKARLWDIMKDGGNFVKKNKKAKKSGVCGKDCWLGCDKFDKNPVHDFCTHCDTITCRPGVDCQCCTGWCDMPVKLLQPSASKFLRLAFHDCLKLVFFSLMFYNTVGDVVHLIKC